MSSPPSGARGRVTDGVEVVVDSSVLVAACLAGGAPGRLRGHGLHAPAHMAAEVTSSIREQSYRGEIPPDEAAVALGFLATFEIAFDPPGRRASDALELAQQLGWAKTYDAEYVALARALGLPLVTLDRRLVRGAGALVRVLTPTDL
jgi:predicted nucleic acid-binding protein